MRLFHTPSFSHLLSLRLAVESSPYFIGTSIHLHPVIRTKSTAFTVDLSSALGLPSFAPGGSRGSILLHLTSSISSNFMKRRGCQTIISISRPRKLDKGVSIEIGSVVLRPFHDVFWPKPPEVPQCVLHSHPHRPPRGHSRRTRDVGGADEVRQRSKGVVSDEGLPPLLVPPYICRVPEARIPPEVLVQCRLIDYVSPRYVHQDGTPLRNRELLRAYHPLGEVGQG